MVKEDFSFDTQSGFFYTSNSKFVLDILLPNFGRFIVNSVFLFEFLDFHGL